MAQIEVRINGRSYPIVCSDGEEEHIGQLAHFLDRTVAELAEKAGQVGDSHLLVMAGLMIADELAGKPPESAAQPPKSVDEDLVATVYAQTADRLEQLAARIEDIAEQLERP